ncbi:hypothetical protein [Paraburkholderia sp.]|uniref:hypothetical protein n=1 Tax=Paraburkholderia sp. TaxID=1926495 RepID=UPI002D65A6D5|nr:hypothetical protein [Paraburkholderia sp.]HZZ04622.1 hypothetical protein [Paraburkholderia sp.]
MRRILLSLASAIAASAMVARHTHVGFGLRIAFGHPIAPGRRPSGVRAARRAAAKQRNRTRGC